MPLPRKATITTPEVKTAMRADQIRQVTADVARWVALGQTGDTWAAREIKGALLMTTDTEIADIYRRALVTLGL